jgi:UDP-glucose 4-epimerase
VIHLAGSRSRVEHVSLEQAYGHRFDDMPRRVPDLRKVREAIGFRPRSDLDEIIRSVIDHLRGGHAGAKAD